MCIILVFVVYFHFHLLHYIHTYVHLPCVHTQGVPSCDTFIFLKRTRTCTQIRGQSTHTKRTD